MSSDEMKKAIQILNQHMPSAPPLAPPPPPSGVSRSVLRLSCLKALPYASPLPIAQVQTPKQYDFQEELKKTSE